MNFHKYQTESKRYRIGKNIEAITVLISEFIEEFQNLLTNKDDTFSNIAYNNMLVFLLTQKFRAEISVFIDNLKYDKNFDYYQGFEDIQVQYKRLSNESKILNSKDYRYIIEYNYALKKMLLIIKELIETKKIDYNQQKPDKHISFIKAIRKSFIESTNSFYSLLEFSKKKNHVPIYAPFEQCRTEAKKIIITGKEEEVHLFIDSSHVLPLDFKSDKILFKILSDDISNIFLEIHIIISEKNKKFIEIFSEKNNDYIENLKNQIEKSQHNSIQVIAIFSGLIAFVTASSSAFSGNNYDIRNVILLLVAFSLLFGIFFLLLRSILTTSKYFNVFLLVLFIISLLAFAVYNENLINLIIK